jgi:hypothetical protein
MVGRAGRGGEILRSRGVGRTCTHGGIPSSKERIVKIKLNIEDVQVDSFHTAADEEETSGTVQAFAFSYPHFSCPPKYTCPECANPG